MQTSRDMDKFIVRLPSDVREWVRNEAHRNRASQNSEIVRAIRERMDRVAAGDHFSQANPAAETTATVASGH